MSARKGSEDVFYVELDKIFIEKRKSLYANPQDAERWMDVYDQNPREKTHGERKPVVVVSEHALRMAKRVSRSEGRTHRQPRYLHFRDGDMTCLDGQSRIRAMRLGGSDWGLVKIVLDSIDKETRDEIIHGHSNQIAPNHGILFCRILDAGGKSHRGAAGRDRVSEVQAALSLLSVSERQELVALQNCLRLHQSVVDIMQDIRGMAPGFQLTWKKIRATRCLGSFENYLKGYLYRYWMDVVDKVRLQVNPGDANPDKLNYAILRKIDYATFQALQGLTPGRSDADASTVRGAIANRGLFKDFSRAMRRSFKKVILKTNCMIPSWNLFFQHKESLIRWSKWMKGLLGPARTGAVEDTLRDIYRHKEGKDTPYKIYMSDTSFRVIHAASYKVRQELSCRQLWLFVMRQGDYCKAELPRIACMALKLGFGTQRHGKSKTNDSLEAIGKHIRAAARRGGSEMNDTPETLRNRRECIPFPSTPVDRDSKRRSGKRRDGQKWGVAYAKDKRNFFFDFMETGVEHQPPNTVGYEYACIYRAFFADPFLPSEIARKVPSVDVPDEPDENTDSLLAAEGPLDRSGSTDPPGLLTDDGLSDSESHSSPALNSSGDFAYIVSPQDQGKRSKARSESQAVDHDDECIVTPRVSRETSPESASYQTCDDSDDESNDCVLSEGQETLGFTDNVTEYSEIETPVAHRAELSRAPTSPDQYAPDVRSSVSAPYQSSGHQSSSRHSPSILTIEGDKGEFGKPDVMLTSTDGSRCDESQKGAVREDRTTTTKAPITSFTARQGQGSPSGGVFLQSSGPRDILTRKNPLVPSSKAGMPFLIQNSQTPCGVDERCSPQTPFFDNPSQSTRPISIVERGLRKTVPAKSDAKAKGDTHGGYMSIRRLEFFVKPAAKSGGEQNGQVSIAERDTMVDIDMVDIECTSLQNPRNHNGDNSHRRPGSADRKEIQIPATNGYKQLAVPAAVSGQLRPISPVIQRFTGQTPTPLYRSNAGGWATDKLFDDLDEELSQCEGAPPRNTSQEDNIPLQGNSGPAIHEGPVSLKARVEPSPSVVNKLPPGPSKDGQRRPGGTGNINGSINISRGRRVREHGQEVEGSKRYPGSPSEKIPACPKEGNWILDGDSWVGADTFGDGEFGRIRLVYAKSKFSCRKEVAMQNLDQYQTRQIQQEVQILKNLKHPHIVSYEEHREGQIAGKRFLFIYMEYCSGGDLRGTIEKVHNARIKTPHIPCLQERQICQIIVQIVDALYLCHYRAYFREGVKPKVQAPIIHRDLKPANIFIDHKGFHKLGDFGLSKQLDATRRFTNSYVGTPYYQSPEIRARQPYTTSVDVWAVGCIAYELCQGKVPFGHDVQTHKLLTERIKEGRCDFSGWLYSRELRTIIQRCLTVEPEDRIDTHDLFVELHKLCKTNQEQALHANAGTKPLTTPPSSGVNRPRDPSRRSTKYLQNAAGTLERTFPRIAKFPNSRATTFRLLTPTQPMIPEKHQRPNVGGLNEIQKACERAKAQGLHGPRFNPGQLPFQAPASGLVPPQALDHEHIQQCIGVGSDRVKPIAIAEEMPQEPSSQGAMSLLGMNGMPSQDLKPSQVASQPPSTLTEPQDSRENQAHQEQFGSQMEGIEYDTGSTVPSASLAVHHTLDAHLQSKQDQPQAVSDLAEKVSPTNTHLKKKEDSCQIEKPNIEGTNEVDPECHEISHTPSSCPQPAHVVMPDEPCQTREETQVNSAPHHSLPVSQVESLQKGGLDPTDSGPSKNDHIPNPLALPCDSGKAPSKSIERHEIDVEHTESREQPQELTAYQGAPDSLEFHHTPGPNIQPNSMNSWLGARDTQQQSDFAMDTDLAQGFTHERAPDQMSPNVPGPNQSYIAGPNQSDVPGPIQSDMPVAPESEPHPAELPAGENQPGDVDPCLIGALRPTEAETMTEEQNGPANHEGSVSMDDSRRMAACMGLPCMIPAQASNSNVTYLVSRMEDSEPLNNALPDLATVNQGSKNVAPESKTQKRSHGDLAESERSDIRGTFERQYKYRGHQAGGNKRRILRWDKWIYFVHLLGLELHTQYVNRKLKKQHVNLCVRALSYSDISDVEEDIDKFYKTGGLVYDADLRGLTQNDVKKYLLQTNPHQDARILVMKSESFPTHIIRDQQIEVKQMIDRDLGRNCEEARLKENRRLLAAIGHNLRKPQVANCFNGHTGYGVRVNMKRAYIVFANAKLKVKASSRKKATRRNRKGTN